MAGFFPVGSAPVASAPTGQAGIVYTIDVGSAEARGYDYTFSYTFPGTRVSWMGAEVLHPGESSARVSWIGAEVMHGGESSARVSWMGVEVLRSIATASGDSGFVSILW